MKLPIRNQVWSEPDAYIGATMSLNGQARYREKLKKGSGRTYNHAWEITEAPSAEYVPAITQVVIVPLENSDEVPTPQ